MSRATSPRAVATIGALALVLSASPALAGPDAALEHDVPVQGKHMADYDYWTPFSWWSGVAVRPKKKADITLYADEARTNALARSEGKKKEIDVVVVDSNHAARYTTYYPTVRGKGRFQVEADYDNDGLYFQRPLTHVMANSDVLWSMDTQLDPGEELSITASTNGDNDIEMLVFQSDALASPTLYQGRASAICDQDSGGAGSSETCVIINDADVTDWFGVMILNKKGSGTISMTRSS